jgi:hypothetical protein
VATIHVNKTLAMSLLRLAVADKGEDYVVPVYHVDTQEEYQREEGEPSGRHPNSSCRNFVPKQGVPQREWPASCMIGHCLSYLGFTGEDMEYEGRALNAVSVGSLYRLPDLELSSEAEAIWLAAQQVQDQGKTWGKALAAAERVPVPA